MREASEGFLAEFPLLFGYWKKYAEFEFKHDTTESSRWTEIYERGCSFVRFTADLWSFYCSSVVERCPDADFVRRFGICCLILFYISNTIIIIYLFFEERNRPEEENAHRRIHSVDLFSVKSI